MPFDPRLLIWIAVGFFAGAVLAVIGAKIFGMGLVGKSKRQALQLITDAERDAHATKKEARTAIKEQRVEVRAQAEREIRESRKEIVSLEKRILTKEENLDKRFQTLETKTNEVNSRIQGLADRERNLEKHKARLDSLIAEQVSALEGISGMTGEEARRRIIEQLEAEVRRDTVMRLKRIEDEMIENADKKARWIVGEAVQRCAADHVAETTVSVVPLPNDEMKGRIIGREGRNIRALESATGINLIIDDTPEAIILSGFDTVRREIARIALERLIKDGRIHPARIEEVVDKIGKEMDKNLKERGEAACLEADVHGLHPEIVRLLGRLSYRTSYGQNVLKHSTEVCHLNGIMAAELGLNIQEAKRAGLIHDIGKALTHEVEGPHAEIGREFARRHGENDTICNCIAAHHGDVTPESVIAILTQAGDALSAARPGARSETVQNYLKRLEALEDIAKDFPGVLKAYAIQAGREIRVAVEPEKISDSEALQLARDVARRVEDELVYPGQIKVTVLRETRAVETAR